MTRPMTDGGERSPVATAPGPPVTARSRMRRIAGPVLRSIVRRPGRVLVTIALVGGVGIFSWNALMRQPSRHPAPLFAARPCGAGGRAVSPSPRWPGCRFRPPAPIRELSPAVQAAGRAAAGRLAARSDRRPDPVLRSRCQSRGCSGCIVGAARCGPEGPRQARLRSSRGGWRDGVHDASGDRTVRARPEPAGDGRSGAADAQADRSVIGYSDRMSDPTTPTVAATPV